MEGQGLQEEADDTDGDHPEHKNPDGRSAQREQFWNSCALA